MILHRFVKHVSDQNWFAVGLDVIVVIVGIFLGMQVSDWNERRKGQALEQQLLANMHEEMIRERTLLGNKIAFLERRVVLMRELYDWLESGGLTPLNEEALLANGVCRTGVLLGLGQPFSSYQEMIASGRLSMLASQKTKKALMTYAAAKAYSDQLMTTVSPEMQKAYDGIAPWRSYLLSTSKHRCRFNFTGLLDDQSATEKIAHIEQLESYYLTQFQLLIEAADNAIEGFK